MNQYTVFLITEKDRVEFHYNIKAPTKELAELFAIEEARANNLTAHIVRTLIIDLKNTPI